LVHDFTIELGPERACDRRVFDLHPDRAVDHRFDPLFAEP
jgi:hypothetical protein